jgi:hypothetical protein
MKHGIDLSKTSVHEKINHVTTRQNKTPAEKDLGGCFTNKAMKLMADWYRP